MYITKKHISRRTVLKGIGATSILLASSDLISELIAQSPKGDPLHSKFKGLADIALTEAKTAGCSYADIRFTRTMNLPGVNVTASNVADAVPQQPDAAAGGGFGGGGGARGGGRGGGGGGGGFGFGGRGGNAGPPNDPDGTPRPVDDREDATTAITAYCAAAGAWGVRVHDVRPSVDAALTIAAIGRNS